jgi:hypothetical protein
MNVAPGTRPFIKWHTAKQFRPSSSALTTVAVLCRLFERRIHENLLASRRRLISVLLASTTQHKHLFELLPRPLLLENMLCMLTPFENVSVLPLVSHSSAMLAASDISCFLMVQRLYIRPSTYISEWSFAYDSWDEWDLLDDATKLQHDVEDNHKQCVVDDAELARYLLRPQTTTTSPATLYTDAITLQPSSIEGTGVFAVRDIEANEPLCVVTGAYELANNLHSEDHHSFKLPREPGFATTTGDQTTVLTPFGRNGEDHRSKVHFCNHSCFPNAHIVFLNIKDAHANAALPFRRDPGGGSSCSWLSRHRALRSAWLSFCVPLLQYESRLDEQDFVYSDRNHKTELIRTLTERTAARRLYVLCAKGRKIPKSDEVTYTYCNVGNEGIVRNGGMGRIKINTFDDQICGCPHSDAEQHYMTGRHVNETYGEFRERCRERATNSSFCRLQEQYLHRDFDAPNMETCRTYTDEEVQSM